MITQAFVIAWHFSPQLGSLYDIFGISVVDNRLSATHLGSLMCLSLDSLLVYLH